MRCFSLSFSGGGLGSKTCLRAPNPALSVQTDKQERGLRGYLGEAKRWWGCLPPPLVPSGSGTGGQRLWGAFLGFLSGKMNERIFPLPSLHQKLGYGAINPSWSDVCWAALTRGSPSSRQPRCPLSPGVLARQKQWLPRMGNAVPTAQHGKPGDAGGGRGTGSRHVVDCAGVSAPQLSWDSPRWAHPGPHSERGSGAVPAWLMAHLAGEGHG